MDTSTFVWGTHVVAVAPALYLARNSPEVLSALLAGVLGYHLYRLFNNLYRGTCLDADADLLHILVIVPLLFLGRKSPQLVSLVAALTALYFLSKMAVRTSCPQNK